MDKQLPAPRPEHIQVQPVQPPAIQTSAEPLPKIFNTKTITVLVSGTVAMTALLKADSKDIPKIVETLAGSGGFSLVGWVLAVVFLLVGAVMVTVLIKIYGKEIARISHERNELQKLLIERTQSK